MTGFVETFDLPFANLCSNVLFWNTYMLEHWMLSWQVYYTCATSSNYRESRQGIRSVNRFSLRLFKDTCYYCISDSVRIKKTREKKYFICILDLHSALYSTHLWLLNGYNIDEHLKDLAAIENTWIYCTETFITQMSHWKFFHRWPGGFVLLHPAT